MKSILMSIKSIPVCNIANRYKTYEIRRKFPKDFSGWIYIYCTKAEPILFKYEYWSNENGFEEIYAYFPTAMKVTPKIFEHDFGEGKSIKNVSENLNGKVVARFWVDDVQDIYLVPIDKSGYGEDTCLDEEEIHRYLDTREKGFAIHISKLEIFDKPKTLANFNLIRAPQSWQYIYE